MSQKFNDSMDQEDQDEYNFFNIFRKLDKMIEINKKKNDINETLIEKTIYKTNSLTITQTKIITKDIPLKKIYYR